MQYVTAENVKWHNIIYTSEDDETYYNMSSNNELILNKKMCKK